MTVGRHDDVEKKVGEIVEVGRQIENCKDRLRKVGVNERR